MKQSQFSVLYRQFLTRIIDLELLSSHAHGDASTLAGQFASLLVFISILIGFSALGSMGSALPWQLAWGMEHFLISTTMLAVGIFAVLSWDSAFLNRRDVLVLSPLPIRSRTLFLAKTAATGTSLFMTVATLHVAAGLTWPAALSAKTGVLNMLRFFFAYWGTMLAAGAFIFCSVLALQGLAAQLLPRQLFLRISSFLQIAAFCLFVTVYFLQPGLVTSGSLEGSWSPPYWFLGLFQYLSGSDRLFPLAKRALIACATVGFGTAIGYVLSYFRTLRQIVEEPDILPTRGTLHSLPPFGTAFQTALVHFSIRTLLRSRQHRVILAFYLGIGFAITIFFLKSPAGREISAVAGVDQWRSASMPLLASSIIMLGFCVAGIRVVFSLPQELKANWMFQITPVTGGPECFAARRRAVWTLAVAPIVCLSAVVLFSVWPWRQAAAHTLILCALGGILTDVSLLGVPRLPFACSWLPGKSNVHITFWMAILFIMQTVGQAAELERRLMKNTLHFTVLLAALAVAGMGTRWLSKTQSESYRNDLQFEAIPDWELLNLALPKDGGLPEHP